MTVILDNIDPPWHEELLTICLLRQADCSRSELKKRIRRAQETKVTPFPAHSNSAYNYWFHALKKRGIIVEQDGILGLTKLGRWIAEGSVSGLSARNQFAYLICERCSNCFDIVVRTPSTDTMRTNSKGNPFMDIKCHRCGSLSEQNNLGGIANKSEFVDFYNQAIVELGKFVRLEAYPI